MRILIAILLVCLGSPGIAWAQPEIEKKPENKTGCRYQPYKQHCQAAGVGLILGINSSPFSWGASFKYGYFILDRLKPAAVFEFSLQNSQSQYEAGLDLTYSIGPVFGFIISPGYTGRILFIRGPTRAEAGAHGPFIHLAIRIRHNLTLGCEFYHNLNQLNSDFNEKTRLVFPSLKYIW